MFVLLQLVNRKMTDLIKQQQIECDGLMILLLIPWEVVETFQKTSVLIIAKNTIVVSSLVNEVMLAIVTKTTQLKATKSIESRKKLLIGL